MPKLTPTRFRRIIQSAFALTSLFIGYRFVAFLAWAHGTGPEAARPASVEAFLPISALMGAKRLVLTGQWDPFHPAGLALLLCFLLMAWLLRKGFCGYVCPVGLLSDGLAWLGDRLGLGMTMPRKAGLALNGLKYLLLGFFLFNIMSMPLPALNQFLRSPYNLTADARMLAFFTSPGNTALTVLGVLALLGMMFRGFWCRFLCPYGALLGLAALPSPLAVSREEIACIDCGKCSRACPSGIQVEKKTAVLSPECMGCASCIEACPIEGCLTVRAGKRRLPYWIIGLGCVVLVAACFALATATGHWTAVLPPDMAKMLYGK